MAPEFIVVTAFLTLLLAKTVAELWLDALNAREIRRNAGSVPEAFADFISPQDYEKSVQYSLAKLGFGRVETVTSAVILAVALAGGLVAVLYEGATGVTGTGVWGQAVALAFVMLVLALPGLPFDWYATFRLEARFGFNQATPALWVSDKLKGLVLSLLLGLPLLALLLWFVQAAPQTWWLWGFLALFAVQLLLLVLYPRVILPLFNKLSPLPEGGLRERLLNLGERAGFTVTNILIIDGSKRSRHSNALFTGFGKFRQIILYDTLLEQLGEREVEAVLAHEIGHYKRGHVPKMLAMAFVNLGAGFAALGWLATQAWFVEAFGFTHRAGEVGPALLVLSLAAGLVTFWLGPLTAAVSRKFEYEADAFARGMMGGDPSPLTAALRKLHTENKANLTPHPAYSRFYYSHPTLLEREAALAST